MTMSEENQTIKDAARARILEQLRQDGWPEPQTEEEFRYAALAHRVLAQGKPAPGLTEEEAMRIAIEETKLSRAERDAKSST
ncbi:hypothetical protein CVAR_0763 [Corynebacterium variabile DSM 44702]|uniref:Uncharacterized protein n=2 Tax=Corynebacterium variabile TaxID=1727 RepID=G0HAA0_CORVD|nr:hypothetical protein CVAR_0763 [Corynebacterium variabile DSM 44702]